VNKEKFFIYPGLVVSMIIWSLSFIWYKDAYLFLGPITTITLRLLISAIFMFTFSFIIGKLQPMKWKDLKLIIVAAFFEPFLYFIGESFGMQLVSSSLAAIIISTIPLFSPVAAFYLVGERITKTNFTGIVLSIVGIVLVIFNKGFLMNTSFKGILLMFFAVFSAVGYSVSVRKIATQYNPFTIVTYQNLIGFVLFLPLFLIFEFPTIKATAINAKSMTTLLELGIFASSVAFILFTYSIRKIGITKANMFTNIIPVFTAIFAYFLLGERFNHIKILGIALVIAGLFLSQLDSSKVREQILSTINGKDK
jgi:drug/metabolite transporter (DMT)-like permease